jgi:hypothetical protein
MTGPPEETTPPERKPYTQRGKAGFLPGNPGRPPGARHRATLAALALLDGEAERLSRKAVEMALEGDVTALRLCLERIAPPRKDAPIRLPDLPPIETMADALAALDAVIAGMARGDVTPAEAAAAAGLLETRRRMVETSEIEQRIAALERKATGP